MLMFGRRQWVGLGNRVLGKTVLGEDPLEMPVTDKHRPGTQLTQRLSDTDAVQGRAKTGFREQGDQFFFVHGIGPSAAGCPRFS
ncbi:hypothetical protein D3C71_1833030 [compost metagenome]